MTYLAISFLVFLAPFLFGVGLILALIGAGAVGGSFRQEQSAGDAPRAVPARRAASLAAFEQAPGFEIVDFSFRHR